MSTETDFNPVKSQFGNLLRFLVDTFMTYSRLAFLEGKMEAKRDLANKKLALRTYGKPAKWRHIYADILYEKYKVELRVIAGEHVTERQREETHGYNSVMKPSLRKKFGRDFLDAAVDIAKDIHSRQEKASASAENSPVSPAR